MLNLAVQFGADAHLAEKAVAFVEWGWAVVTPTCTMASPTWFLWAEPLVMMNPAAAAVGMSILGEYHNSIKKPAIAVALFAKAYATGLVAAERKAQEEEVDREEKRRLAELEALEKSLRDAVAKGVAETNSPEFAAMIQAIARPLLEKAAAAKTNLQK
jgi:hypothetical protein